jgi:hypothetical protein
VAVTSVRFVLVALLLGVLVLKEAPHMPMWSVKAQESEIRVV